MWKSPESYTDHSPPPQSVTPFFLTVPGITLDIIKGVCLKRPKDFDNNKNFYAQPYPSVQGGQGQDGEMD